MARFFISVVVVGVLLLAVGGWTVRGLRWAVTLGRRPALVPAN